MAKEAHWGHVLSRTLHVFDTSKSDLRALGTCLTLNCAMVRSAVVRSEDRNAKDSEAVLGTESLPPIPLENDQ